MVNLTTVGITSGVPSSGTGTVSTIDNLLALGVPISNGSSSLQVGIVGASSAPQATQPGLVVVDSPNSSARTVTPSSNFTVILSSNPTFAGGTITSLSSGVVSIGNAGTIANVVATSSAMTSSMPALIVGSFDKLAFGVAQLTQSSVSVASSGNNVLVTETSSQTIRVYGLYLISSAPNTLTFCAGSTATPLSGAMYLQGFTLQVQAEPYFTSSQNFVINLASPGQMSGMIYYIQS